MDSRTRKNQQEEKINHAAKRIARDHPPFTERKKGKRKGKGGRTFVISQTEQKKS